MRDALGRLLLPVFLVVYVLFFLGTVDGRLQGDDHYALAHAAALLAGDRLDVDLFDPGSPLQTLLSYAGQSVSGSRPIAEILIALAIRLAGLTAVYVLTFRLARSRIAAVLAVATIALLLLDQTIYGAEKVALYPIAVLAAWRYLDGRLSPYALSCVIAVATLFRHDHGAYITGALTLAVALGPRPGRDLFKMIAGTIVLLSPWLVWVQSTEGVVSYAVSRIDFARDNGLGRTRPFGFSLPFIWSDNADRLLWHIAAATTVATLIISIRRRSLHVIVLASIGLIAALGLMRKEGQAAEVAALWIPLLMWWIRESAWISRVALAAVAAVTMAAVVTSTQALEEIPQIAFEGGGLRQRVRRAIDYQTVTPSIDAYAPPDEEEISDGRLVIRYVHECLRPSDRIWETAMWFPVTYHAQRRPVWHLHWDHGLKHDEASQRQFLKWMEGQQAPVIISHTDDPWHPFREYPLVRQYVMTYYREITSDRLEAYRADGNHLWLLADIRRAPTGRFERLDLPCFSE